MSMSMYMNKPDFYCDLKLGVQIRKTEKGWETSFYWAGGEASKIFQDLEEAKASAKELISLQVGNCLDKLEKVHV